MSDVVLIQIFSCWFLTGLIWLVQVLVYPNFRLIGPVEFKNFHDFHMKRITWIVAPVMGLELLSAIVLIANDRSTFNLLNGVSILLLWALTGLINVPTHNRLQHEVELTKHRLIVGNWPRTIIWSLRSLVWIWVMHLQLIKGIV
ncbi:MAG: hypothetical protein H7256_13630 [Bdellovibrio sp.]|nr:hypothetical protein [Bdellovibrio sp.]